MTKIKSFHREGDKNVIEFDDGWKLYTSKQNLTQEERRRLETMKNFIDARIKALLDDMLDEMKNKLKPKLNAMHDDIKAIKSKVEA